MILGKQRSFLKSLAHSKEPTLQLGKQGLTDAFIKQLEINLETEELVKINILNNNDYTPRELFEELSAELDGLEFVQAIGSKLTVYRRSENSPKIILP